LAAAGYLSIRGDGDRQIAERLIAGAHGRDAVPGAIPFLAPPGQRQVRGGQVVAGRGQPFAALHHMHTVGVPIGALPAQLGAQPVQAALLLKPFGLSGVALRQFGLRAGLFVPLL
jgi:hypothetical protein